VSGETPRREIRRVTALVESGRPAADLLLTAAELAARLHADVQGVLLEDPNLRRFARLDVARVVSRFAAAGPVGPGDVLAMVEQLAAQAQAALQGAAQSLGLAWSFQVMTAAPELELRAALRPYDLLVVELDREPTAARARQAVGLWSATAVPMLVVRGRWRASRPAVLIAAPSADADRAVQAAAELLTAEAPHLDVLLVAPDADAAPLAAWIRQRARDHGRRAHVTVLPDGAVPTVLRAARHAAAGLLVLPADAACLADPVQLEAMLEQASCALLLLR